MPHAGPVRTLVILLVAAVLVGGCSGGGSCRGQSYHADRSQPGETTPIAALDTWLDSTVGFDRTPPDDGWTVQDSGDPKASRVVITNEAGDGWWVSVLRTDPGGYVVDGATDNASACGDELS